MAHEKRIAVLMPAYNPGPEIAHTLDSLRAQTVPFKLFVIDDGSAAGRTTPPCSRTSTTISSSHRAISV